ncbi:CBS domain-containing protein, partial [Rhodovulum sp. 12E13]|uniref:transporter associated domain-containing protein n=1 Tax=Rhodovulum sp. 12E13 TaxID=2203891 RepID=UPI000E137A6C
SFWRPETRGISEPIHTSRAATASTWKPAPGKTSFQPHFFSGLLSTRRKGNQQILPQRLPLRRDGPDDIVGVLHSRDLLATTDAEFDALALMRPAPAIRETLPALEVIDRLRTAPCHMLLVHDEHGHFEGIVTPMDVLGTIAGGFDEPQSDEPEFVERGDGSLLVAGRMPVDAFMERLPLAIPRPTNADTAAGLVMERLGEVPRVGQTVEIGGWRIEIIDMDGLRIDKLLVRRGPGSSGAPS